MFIHSENGTYLSPVCTEIRTNATFCQHIFLLNAVKSAAYTLSRSDVTSARGRGGGKGKGGSRVERD